MALDGIAVSSSSTSIRDSGGASRAGSVADALAARSRFGQFDPSLVSSQQTATPTRTADDRQPEASTVWPDGSGGQGSTQALSAFVTQSLAQSQDQAAGPSEASRTNAAIAAYARAGGSAAVPPDTSVEVIAPSLPTLSSGRTLDLAV